MQNVTIIAIVTFNSTLRYCSKKAAKKIRSRYSPLRTTYVKRTLYAVSLEFCGEELSHKQIADKYALRCPLDNKDFYRHYAKAGSRSESY